MKTAWIDVRKASDEFRDAVVEAAVHAGVSAIVDNRLDALALVPPTVRKVYFPRNGSGVIGGDGFSIDDVDIVVEPVAEWHELESMKQRTTERKPRTAAFITVSDQASLDLACAAAAQLPFTVLHFTDPTKIPLEIVIAAAEGNAGELVTCVFDLEEAAVVAGCLEKGSDGVLFPPSDLGTLSQLTQLLEAKTPRLDLVELTVDGIEHIGLGDRVCVDTCSHFLEDEGILVGSFSSGFVLCCSETHPLPYMPTRPFRVNAGALHSYVLRDENRTNYLSELRAGSHVLAVRADGTTRNVAVGRIKLETRPLLRINATARESGVAVSLTVQDDWHVRVLGPGAAVLNVTALEPGDRLLGYLATDSRHVGYPVAEFCVER
jgi:3-amino-4-hydroxybenzoic acid synthase